MVRISIVTICRDNLQDLLATCTMVDQQSLPPFEHIIIDGSTNNEIHEYLSTNGQPAYRRWVCEPDEGISDAFNKGIKMASGDVIHLQNAGDYYYNEDVLADVVYTFTKHPEIMWLHGKYAQFRGDTWLISGKPYERSKLYRGMRTIGHPTMFLRRQLYQVYGYFDKDKKIAMDYDMLVRIANEPFCFLDKPLVFFTPGGVSTKRISKGLDEVKNSYYKYIGKDMRVGLWGLRIKLLNTFTASPLGKLLFKAKNAAKRIEEPGM